MRTEEHGPTMERRRSPPRRMPVGAEVVPGGVHFRVWAPSRSRVEVVGAGWSVLWSSEDPRYGGGGTPALEDDGALRLPGHAALLLAPAPEVPLG